VSKLFKRLLGLLSDQLFTIGLSVFWLALGLVHYFPKEIPYADRAPNFTPVLIILSLAVGCRLPSAQGKSAWYAAFAAICIVLLSCGYDIGVYPMLRTDAYSACIAITATVAASLTTALAFFKLGQLLGFQITQQSCKAVLKKLSISGICVCAICAAFMLIHSGPGILIVGLLFFPVKPRLPVFVTALLVALFCQSTTAKFVFSPYKKFEVQEKNPKLFILNSDGLPFNSCAQIPDPKEFQLIAKLAAPAQPDIVTIRHYLGRLAMPLGLSRHKLEDILILGASSGNDLSFLLKNGAENIDAIEPDLALIEIASAHPDKPYQNPQVKTHNTDPRIFLQHTNKKYDLIEFCYINSGRSNSAPFAINQESFIHTKECIDLALARLKPEGLLFIGLSAPTNSLAPARLYAAILATQEVAYIAYRQQEALTDPFSTKYYFFALGPGLKKVTRFDLDPLVTQFIHLTPFEDVPLDEQGATDNRPFLRADARNSFIWYFALVVILFSVSLPFVRKSGDPPARPVNLTPVALGIIIALSNYLSLANLSLLAGFQWFLPLAILSYDSACFLLCSVVKTRAVSTFLYLCATIACGALACLSDQPIIVCIAANLLTMITAFILCDLQRDYSPTMVFSSSLAGLASGSIAAVFALAYGLSSLGVVCLILLVFTFQSTKKYRSKSGIETNF
jgi:hypothetical protein